MECEVLRLHLGLFRERKQPQEAESLQPSVALGTSLAFQVLA
jgi:hypothetical protein